MKRFSFGRKQLLLIVICLVIAGAVFFWAWSRKHQDKTPEEQTADYAALCNTDDIGVQLREKFAHFDSSQANELGTLVEEIKKLGEHEKSPTCLYVLGKHAMYTGQLTEASGYFDALVALEASTGQWFSEDYGFDTPEDIAGISQSLKDSVGTYRNRTTWQKPAQEGGEE